MTAGRPRRVADSYVHRAAARPSRVVPGGDVVPHGAPGRGGRGAGGTRPDRRGRPPRGRLRPGPRFHAGSGGRGVGTPSGVGGSQSRSVQTPAGSSTGRRRAVKVATAPTPTRTRIAPASCVGEGRSAKINAPHTMVSTGCSRMKVEVSAAGSRGRANVTGA